MTRAFLGFWVRACQQLHIPRPAVPGSHGLLSPPVLLILVVLAYVVWLLAQGTGTPGLGVRPLSGPAFLKRSAPEFPLVFMADNTSTLETPAPSTCPCFYSLVSSR